MHRLTKKWFFFVLLLLGIKCSTCMAEVKEPPTIPYPVIHYHALKNPDLVKKGEYLVKAGDCIACHTNTAQPDAKPFAGGLGLQTPFGTFFTSNITPDKETGIGNWSDKDFIRAMHSGLNPRYENYFPVFPYLYFNRISEEDLLAIKAYLFSLPPIKSIPPKNDVPWPFNVRISLWGWKMLFFLPNSGYYKEDKTKSSQWNRGAYLVQGLEHCGMCHTPINLMGAPKNAYFLAGGVVDNFPAPNITSERLKDFTVDQVIDVFLKDQMLGGGKVQGPMLDVNRNSLKYLSREDLEAIVIYLKTVKSKPIPKPKIKSGADLGQGIYDAYCATCHASGAAGAPVVGDKTEWDLRAKQGVAMLYHNAINGYNSMPAKGTCSSCTNQEIEAAVQYMINNSKEGGAENKKAPPNMPSPTANLSNGAKVYIESCAVCHNNGSLGAPKLGDKKVWAPIINQNMDILFDRTLKGYKGMPAKGGCEACSGKDIIDAVIYMVQQSKEGGDYKLW